VAAGFPCQDLSQAGRTAGIEGAQSGLVDHVFRLLDEAKHEFRWLLLENVPFMLQLDRGDAMSYLVRELGLRGWRWAYRVVDTRAFGLPHRRLRVILLASRSADPRPVLFGEQVTPVEREPTRDSFFGFYWTEGLRGLGWAVDAVPTIKGGSTVGIPSPPAIWIRRSGALVTPDLRDAERLQGFPVDWTQPAADPQRRNGPRWKLVGNAVSVPLARWVGDRLNTDDQWEGRGQARQAGGSWPAAAWGEGAQAFEVESSTWPRAEPYVPLGEFLQFEPLPLSKRAAAGFLSRARRGSLRFAPGFLEAVAKHVAAHDAEDQAAAA
jgi:DNA (cytosine-5)-methyltransferase 1